jgi:hypothetical protein
MKICQSCSFENKGTSKFCIKCGTKLEDPQNFCPQCGGKLKASSKFCPLCGIKISTEKISTIIQDPISRTNSISDMIEQDESVNSILTNREYVFKLFRLYNEHHIINKAKLPQYRQAYYTALKMLTECIASTPGYKELFSDIRTVFNIGEGNDQYDVKKDCKLLHKKYVQREEGWFSLFKKPIYIYNYSYHLIIETAALLQSVENFNIEWYLDGVVKIFSLSKKEIIWFNQYFELMNAKNFKALVQYVDDSTIKYMKVSVGKLTRHIANTFIYETLPVFHIAVTATMSAGKSTFVNALLGNEIFPESNTACTAKITSVYDNDLYNRVTGIALHNGKLKNISNNLTNVDLAEWNGNADFDRIILEGNLDNITNSKKIVAVHDTPGTNFSGDLTHHDITFDFLKKNKMDVIIYVANAEHLATTDERYLLTELYEKIAKPQNSKVIFIINKADSLDAEKENVSTHCQVLRDEITAIGFAPNSVIIPVSAKYARLFKMVLTDKANKLTAKETCDLITGLSILKEDSSIVSVSDKAGVSTTQESSSIITIGNQVFTVQEIKQALYNTGFAVVESALELLASK